MKFLSLIILLISCGSEAKFHSVYTYNEVPKEKKRDFYSCEYIDKNGQEVYQCTQIFPKHCFDD